jgi:biopolymer transport protein ExbD
MSASVLNPESAEPMMEINTTPLIDVMLVLLIMFIITLPVMTHAVKLDMPQSKNQPPPDVVIEPIQLEVDWDGTVIWNGTPVQLSALEGYFRVEAAKNPQPEVHVRPNRRAPYDTVAKVLALAQRNNMQRIGFVGNEQFME